MTDIEKFKDLFDEIGIKYMERTYYPKDNVTTTEISISENNLDKYGYGKALDIVFMSGKFEKFSPWGE